MNYTMKTIKDRFKALGLEWTPKAFGLTGYKPTHNGFVVKPGFMGMTRPYWNDMLFGSSTFCFVFCPVIAKYPLTDAVFATFPDTELWVFEIPADIHTAAVEQIGDQGRYLALPVCKTDPFPSHNYNPILLHSPEDARKYLTGWL